MLIGRKRKLLMLTAALSAGTVFQYLPSGCAEYYTQIAAQSLNFCGIFNCTGGQFFDFCSPVPLFVDCPTPTTTQ